MSSIQYLPNENFEQYGVNNKNNYYSNSNQRYNTLDSEVNNFSPYTKPDFNIEKVNESNSKIQNDLRQSLKDMYLRNIDFNLQRKNAEREKKIIEEREYISKMDFIRKNQEQRAKEDQQKMKKLLFHEYINYNNLGNFYSNEGQLNDVYYNQFKEKKENTDDHRTLNTEKDFSNNHKLNFKKKENLNISNKICRNYFEENKALFNENANSDYFKTSGKIEEKLKGKKMGNFVEMGQYYNEEKFKESSSLRVPSGYNNSNSKLLQIKPYVSQNRQNQVLGNSELKHNPITNPINYFDEGRYKGYLNFIAK